MEGREIARNVSGSNKGIGGIREETNTKDMEVNQRPTQ